MCVFNDYNIGLGDIACILIIIILELHFVFFEWLIRIFTIHLNFAGMR